MTKRSVREELHTGVIGLVWTRSGESFGSRGKHKGLVVRTGVYPTRLGKRGLDHTSSDWGTHPATYSVLTPCLGFSGQESLTPYQRILRPSLRVVLHKGK